MPDPKPSFAPADWKLTAALAGCGAVFLANLSLEIVGVDASQYASIAREMAENGQWLEVQHRGEDYATLGRPDKPPLLFWLSALSISAFGASEWAYRLPSSLAALLAVYSVYRFARLHYAERTARLAALMAASSQAMFLMTNDVRTDTLLTAFVAFTLWQAGAYLKTESRANFWLGFTGVGLAMLAKGPIGLIALGAAFVPDLLMKGRWRDLFRWRWLLGLGWALLLLVPMCYGLYEQFGWYGPYVYFWEQSFGRITGENVWKDDSDSFFFVHTFAWSFLPWTLFLIPAFFGRAVSFYKSRLRLSEGEESASFWGFLLLLVALSQSQYKLPHYIYPIVPHAAVLTAAFVSRQAEGKAFARLALGNFWVVGHALFAVPLLLLVYGFPPEGALPYLVLALGYVVFLYSGIKAKGVWERAVWPTAACIVAVNLVLSLHVFPARDVYEAGNRVGRDYRQAIRDGRMSGFRINLHAVDFYGRAIVPKIDSTDEARALPAGHLLFCGEKAKGALDSAGVAYEVLESYPDYDVTRMKPYFLNAETRQNGRPQPDGSRKPVLRPLYVLRLGERL